MISVVFRTPKALVVRTENGRDYSLVEPIQLRDSYGNEYCCPVGAESDGCSWDPLPPYGPWWRGAYVHDCGYRDTLLMLRYGTWVKASLPQDACDELFLACMVTDGVEESIRNTIYEGVHFLGWRAFRGDRAGEKS